MIIISRILVCLATLYIAVANAATLTEGPVSVSVLVGENALFHCNGSGVTIAWIVDGLLETNPIIVDRGISSTITSSSGTVQSTLTVPAIQVNNDTIVQCRVVSLSGFVVSNNATLTLLPIPGIGQVRNVRFTDSLSDVQWDPPLTALSGLMYEVTTMDMNTGQIVVNETTNNTFCELVNCQHYTVDVTPFFQAPGYEAMATFTDLMENRNYTTLNIHYNGEVVQQSQQVEISTFGVRYVTVMAMENGSISWSLIFRSVEYIEGHVEPASSFILFRCNSTHNGTIDQTAGCIGVAPHPSYTIIATDADAEEDIIQIVVEPVTITRVSVPDVTTTTSTRTMMLSSSIAPTIASSNDNTTVAIVSGIIAVVLEMAIIVILVILLKLCCNNRLRKPQKTVVEMDPPQHISHQQSIEDHQLNIEQTCDPATMTEHSEDMDKPSPQVDNFSNSSGTPAPLSDVPTHKELRFELEEITEWKELGLLLDLPYHELKKIEKLNKGVEIHKMELFDLWLKNAETPTWETIVCAVREFNPNLARKIARNYLRTSHFSKGKSATDNSDIEQQLAGESLNQTYHFSSASSSRFQQSSQTFLPPKSVSRPPFLLPAPRVSVILVIIM